MRLGTFRSAGSMETWVGIVLDGESVVNVGEAGPAAGCPLPNDPSELLGVWGWRRKLELIGEYAAQTGIGVTPREDLETLAPVPSPGKVVAVGLNYSDHAAEGGHDVPETPVLFAKFPSSVIGPKQPITWDPTVAEKVDYEAELVVVIGETAARVDEETAADAIAGYTVGNDVSARDIQHGDGQWVRGKSLDTFAPIGPEIVTPDELPAPPELDIWTEVNGERLQDSSTENLIFGVAELVSFISQTTTLYPGDLIFTGTPPGVGVYRDPPALLSEGDSVSVGIEGIGVLTNECQYR